MDTIPATSWQNCYRQMEKRMRIDSGGDVSTNLEARRLRLLFVADDIPDPLERVVEFLNRQMPNIEVLAVEIKQFRGKLTQALVPRVIGKTAGKVGSPPEADPRVILGRGSPAAKRGMLRVAFLRWLVNLEPL